VRAIYAAPMPDPDPLAVLASQPGVPAAMTAARDAVDALLRDRGMRRTGPDDTVESLLRGAAASAALAGSDSSLDDLRAGQVDSIAAAAIRVSTELMGLQPVWRRSPVQALARLHSLATDDTDELQGRPESAAGAAAMQRLGDVVRAGTNAPAMVLAAVVHAEVATASGFGAAAGLVARAAERLVLVDTGVDPAAATVPEAGHARSPQAYERALAGYRDAGTPGVVAWLLQAADAYAHGMQHSPLA
jgi:hypothetical protein